MAIITVANLTKKFKKFIAVDNVSFEIDEGECFGLLGRMRRQVDI
jgi:ABC-type multidrug transport system ATPase subunit